MTQKYEYCIYNCINSERNKSHVSFHMPGHKGGGEFLRLFPEAAMDITELLFSDNLHCPEGVIKKAQEDIAEILGAYKSYITTDGSTSGVYAMLYAAAKRGKKIIIPRNAHKSVYNACKLFNIEPIIIHGGIFGGVMLPPDPVQIEEILKKDSSVSAVLTVSPDYYGNIAPLEQYKDITQKYKKLLLVDGAHGAHLAFEENRRGYCGVYADMWVDGAHKTLPTLTQGAVLNIASDEFQYDAEEALSMFRTTSPSYPIMASVEYGYKYLANNPEVYNKTKILAGQFKNSLNGFTFYPSDDWCKIAVDFLPLGISTKAVEEALERENIYAEMNDGRYILFYISPLTTAESMQKLADVLQKTRRHCVEVAHCHCEERSDVAIWQEQSCHSERSRGIPREEQTTFGGSFGFGYACAQDDKKRLGEATPRHSERSEESRESKQSLQLAEAQTDSRRMPYLQAVSQPWEYAALDEAVGRICAENAGITPPCTPLVTAGEIFTRETIEILKHGNTFGVTDGKVKVVILASPIT